MSDLYREQLLDHSRRPRNYGVLSEATILHHQSNPSCGDVIDVYLIIDQGRIARSTFTGQGCAVSQAATSILIDSLKDRSMAEVLAMTEADMLDLLGVRPGPMRMNCALLAWRAIQSALGRVSAVD